MSRLTSNGSSNRVTSNEATLTVSANGTKITRQPRPLNFNRSTVDANTLIVGRRTQLPQTHTHSHHQLQENGQQPHISRESSTVSNDSIHQYASGTPPIPHDESGFNNIYEPVQLSVKFHEAKVSTSEVLVDLSMLPGAKEGDLADLEPLEGSSKRLYFKIKALPEDPKEAQQQQQQQQQTQDKQGQQQPVQQLQQQQAQALVQQPKISILISNNLQLLLELKMRSPVLVRLKNKKDIEADVVEIYVKDIHISRGDMWHFNSLLLGKCLYKSQKVSFLGNTIRASINGIYRNGRRVFSAYVGDNTKLVFRSESAKLTFLVQLSKEMWDFEESGEIIFHKLVNSLFPQIFKKWQELGRHHLITIVLFTSVDVTTRRWKDLDPGERLTDTKDYYRVVVDQVNILLWSKIMSSLRFEFANFMKDIMLTDDLQREGTKKIQGVFVPAVKGNLLEAINLATTLVTDHFKDPDLRHTTSHFILVTPSTGLFDVDYKLMMQTSRKMLAIDAALDIICLSQPPLHVVPLFRYKDYNFKTQHCIPSWIDVSFWNDSAQYATQWIPRCKIYEIQMMGVMENEISDASIDFLSAPSVAVGKTLLDVMNDYDDDVFKTGTAQPSAVAMTAATAATTTTTTSAPRPGLSSTDSDPRVPRYLKKERSYDSLKPPAAFKPQVVAPLNVISDATASEDVVLGVTNSRSNITAFTSLLNLSLKPTARQQQQQPPPSKPFTADLPRLLKSSSSSAKVESANHSSRSSDTTTNTMKSLRNFTLSSSRSVPINTSTQSRSATPRLIPADPDPKQKMTIPTTPIQNKSNSSSFDSLNGRFMSSSPSRIHHSSSSESLMQQQQQAAAQQQQQSFHQHQRPNGEQQSQDKRPWNIMWTPIENPSQAIDHSSVVSLTNGRWEHVFPPGVKRRAIKWTSFSSPAALPITTTHFPNDFQTNFTFKLYDIILNTGVYDGANSGDLMRDMISLRLSLGFQIIVGPKIDRVENKRKPGGDAKLLVKFVRHHRYEGSRIYMSFDDEIHRISIDFNNNINVQIYKRSNLASLINGYEENIEYLPKIRTRYDDVYCVSEINALANNPKKYNWNHLDQRLAGYDDSMDEDSQVRYKLKFVVLPADIPESALNFANDKLSPEEIRLEGLRKLIGTIYKDRYKSPEEIRRKGSDKKEELTPEINFYTGNLFKFLREHSGPLDYFAKDSLFVDEDSLHLNYDIKLAALAAILQNAKQGINFVDRRWHWKTHKNCFLGLELVNWMLKNFDDVLSKEEAVAFGNKLMEENFFTHVENRHSFLDGHYFYKLNPEYIITDKVTNSPATSAANVDNADSPSNWFGKRDARSSIASENDSSTKNGSSTLNTPVLQAQQEQDNMLIRKLSSPKHQGSPHSQSAQPELKKVVLSRSLIYDVDPGKKSHKPELITVHYDRVHNLEHCFHIRLEWLNTTSKLIDDTVNNWSRLCERYGLKLVETPWNELATIPTRNPFHSFVDIALALNPWTDPEFCEGNGKVILYDSKFFYHIFLLEVSGFLLDNRAAVFFGGTEDFEVSYSWGKPMFKFAQFIHSTGAYIAEIKDTGELFLAPNNSHVARVNVLQVQKLSQGKTNIILDSQKVMLEFRQTCKDAEKLKKIFREAKSRWEIRRDIDEALFNEVGI